MAVLIKKFSCCSLDINVHLVSLLSQFLVDIVVLADFFEVFNEGILLALEVADCTFIDNFAAIPIMHLINICSL